MANSEAGAALAANLNPQTKLLEMRRQMFTVQQALELGKKTAAAKELAFAAKEESVRKRDLEMQSTFIKMDAVIQENNAKKDRAERRAAEESRTAAAKGREIEEGTEQLLALREDVAALERARAKLQKRHDFLAHYQSNNSQEFPDIAAVLERFSTLQSAQRDLLAEQGRLLEEVEAERRELGRLQKARSTHALNAENMTGKIRERVKAARALALRLHQGADEASVARGAKVSELGSALQSIGNLYGRCMTGPYGGTIRHHPGDADVLGYGAEALGQSLDVWGEGKGGGESKDDSPGKREAVEKARAAIAAAAAADITGMAPAAVIAKMKGALSSLIVVGSYLIDYDAIVRERGAWLVEQRRQREEKEAAQQAAAAEELEKQRSKAQRLAAAQEAAVAKTGRGAAPTAAGSASSAAAGAGNGGGVGGAGAGPSSTGDALGSPARGARGAAAGAGPSAASASALGASPPPFSPMKSAPLMGLGASSMAAGGGANPLNLNTLAGTGLGGGGGGAGGLPGSSSAAAAQLAAASNGNGLPGLGARLAAVMQRQGQAAFVVAPGVRLPERIAATVPALSQRTVAALVRGETAALAAARSRRGGDDDSQSVMSVSQRG